MKYRKKPVVVEASIWIKNGDHPQDDCEMITSETSGSQFLAEGKIVRRFRRPDVDGAEPCQHCTLGMDVHGWIDTKEGGHIVCPHDYVITGVKGEMYPCKPDIFEMTYEKVI